MKWVGLTGGIASGKSTSCELFRSLGFSVIDADYLAREALEAPQGEAYEQVIQVFGAHILDKEGAIDRAELGRIVFSDEGQRHRLEAIVHPIVRAKTRRLRRELEEEGAPVVINDVPLLFENSLQGQYDEVLVVYCHLQQQIERLKSRSSYSNEEALLRIQSQMPLEEKKSLASFVIDNTGDLQSLKASIQEATQFLGVN